MEKALNNKLPRRKISKLAMFSFGLSVIGLFLQLLASIPAFFLNIWAFYHIKKNRQAIRGLRLVIAAFGFCFLSFFMSFIIWLWTFDADVLNNDFDNNDLKSADPEYMQTYWMLYKLTEPAGMGLPGPSVTGLTAEDVQLQREIIKIIKKGESISEVISKTVSENAEEIESAWHRGAYAREMIEMVSKFEDIADLTEPRIQAEVGFVRNMIFVSRMYQNYIFLQIARGNYTKATKELVTFDSVIRKVSPNARSLAMRLLCNGLFRRNIKTANYILNQVMVPEGAIDIIAEHFTELKTEQISLKNIAIHEYLSFKNLILDTFGEDVHEDGPFFKRNSMLRAYYNYCSYWASLESEANEFKAVSIVPGFYPKAYAGIHYGSSKVRLWYYVYNPIGARIFRTTAPPFRKLRSMNVRLLIMDDLFGVVIAMRQNRPPDLKARAFSDNYLIDLKKKIIFSPGPDYNIYTEDDIILPIEPKAIFSNRKRFPE